jgi:hypothetical protein
MKNLFNNISQDEKNRILEMHLAKKNVISERRETSLTPINGQTVVLYLDKREKKPYSSDLFTNGPKIFSSEFKINYPRKEGDIVKVLLANPVRKALSGVTRYLEFKCGSKQLIMKGTNPPNSIEKEVKPIPLFNLDFVKRLESEYCATSRGGTSVPKANFTMNNQQGNTTTNVA